MDISIKEVLTHLYRISGTGQAEPWGGQIGPIKRPPLMNALSKMHSVKLLKGHE